MAEHSDTQRVILNKAAQHVTLLAEPPEHLPAAARQSVLRSLMAKGLLEEIAAPREHIDLALRQDEDGVQFALQIMPVGLVAIGVEPPQHQPEGQQAAPAQPAEAVLVPAAGRGDSQAAFLPPPLSATSETFEGHQRSPVSHQGRNGHAAALHMAAATVLAAWYSPEQAGMNDAITALRDALAMGPLAPRVPAAPRQPRTGTKQELVLALLRRDDGATIAQVMDATARRQHTVRGFLASLKRKGVTVEVLERIRQVGPSKQGAKSSTRSTATHLPPPRRRRHPHFSANLFRLRAEMIIIGQPGPISARRTRSGMRQGHHQKGKVQCTPC
ncbi:DUF3489 domain-containing protein [Neoroseomonas lacus]|uniref:DUF3489 domain-containing protein n=1 Tax=Neoroseomonas lacus TaxID=287609 RepID=A0A917NI86_9PROT|nr:DUF3489 domain-containing protein [Neoroseomonas lacus]GGJ02448.1 hypothetical protein GCM10011320_06590 [Neoroseomonas lacus]